MTVLAPGTPSPAFALETEEGEKFTERDLRGRTTVLVFYPFAFSSVCTEQLSLYEEILPELRDRGVAIYAVSCDNRRSQHAFAQQLGVTIPQLSDWEPKGATCDAFGVLHPGGFPQRAIVVTDGEGAVRFSYEGDTPNDLPGVNVLFDGLAAVVPHDGAQAGAA